MCIATFTFIKNSPFWRINGCTQADIKIMKVKNMKSKYRIFSNVSRVGVTWAELHEQSDMSSGYRVATNNAQNLQISSENGGNGESDDTMSTIQLYSLQNSTFAFPSSTFSISQETQNSSFRSFLSYLTLPPSRTASLVFDLCFVFVIHNHFHLSFTITSFTAGYLWTNLVYSVAK
jgi:hypothetical protein